MIAARQGQPRVPWDWTDVVLYLVLAFVGGALALAVVSGSVHAADAGLGTAETRSAVESFAGQAAFYAFDFALLLAFVSGRRSAGLAELGWRWPGVGTLLLAIPAVIGALLVASLLTALSTHLMPNETNVQCVNVRRDFGHVLPVAIPAVSVIAPIVEETVFRGFLYGWLRNVMPVGIAVVVSAAIFSAAHFDRLLFLPLLGVGVVLALVYQRTGSLWPGILTHALFNLVGIIQILNAAQC